MSGYDLVRCLKSLYDDQYIPIIALSVYKMGREDIDNKKGLFDEFVSKSDQQVLLQILDDFVGEKKL